MLVYTRDVRLLSLCGLHVSHWARLWAGWGQLPMQYPWCWLWLMCHTQHVLTQELIVHARPACSVCPMLALCESCTVNSGASAAASSMWGWTGCIHCIQHNGLFRGACYMEPYQARLLHWFQHGLIYISPGVSTQGRSYNSIDWIQLMGCIFDTSGLY